VNSANRILGTLGRRGWRLKRAWALSRARDWWRAESSRRLTLGPIWAGCEDLDEGAAELAPPMFPIAPVKGSSSRPAEFASERLAEVVPLASPALGEAAEEDDSAAGEVDRRLEGA
jgi:hypothetical protein